MREQRETPTHDDSSDPAVQSPEITPQWQSTERGTPLTPPGISTLDQEHELRTTSPARSDVVVIPMTQSLDEQRLLVQRTVAAAKVYLAQAAEIHRRAEEAARAQQPETRRALAEATRIQAEAIRLQAEADANARAVPAAPMADAAPQRTPGRRHLLARAWLYAIPALRAVLTLMDELTCGLLLRPVRIAADPHQRDQQLAQINADATRHRTRLAAVTLLVSFVLGILWLIYR